MILSLFSVLSLRDHWFAVGAPVSASQFRTTWTAVCKVWLHSVWSGRFVVAMITHTTVWKSGLCPPSEWGFSSRSQVTTWFLGSSNIAGWTYTQVFLSVVWLLWLKSLLHVLRVSHAAAWVSLVAVTRYFPSRVLMTPFFLSLSCTRTTFPTFFEFYEISSFFWMRTLQSVFTFCRSLSFDLTCSSWPVDRSRLRHVCTDRLLCTSDGVLKLSLSCFKHVWHRFISCRSWLLIVSFVYAFDVWFDCEPTFTSFCIVCILGICRWDSIKDLSTSLTLSLPYDWNVHNSVSELPRDFVSSGSSRLVFTLRDLRDFNRHVDELNLQDFNRLLHLLNRGNLCYVTTDISRILSLDCASVRHLSLSVHGNVFHCDDRLHLMHLHCSQRTRWSVEIFRCHIADTSISLSMYFSSRISNCLSKKVDLCLFDRCRIQTSCSSLSWGSGTASPPLSLRLVHWFTTGSCVEIIFASCVFVTCCVNLRVFDDLLLHFVCVSWHVDDLCNDSFWDWLPWNAVITSTILSTIWETETSKSCWGQCVSSTSDSRMIFLPRRASQWASCLMTLHDLHRSFRHQFESSDRRTIPEKCKSCPCHLSRRASSPSPPFQ